MSEVLISLRGVTHIFNPGTSREKVALLDVSGNIHRGEFLAVIGPNGAGKSTLARHLNALLLPTRGEVLVEGLSTADPASRWEIRRRVGMVLQNPAEQLVAPVLEEDVAFGPENLGLEPAEIRRRVDWALGLTGLAELRLRPPHLLSGGQKQKAALAGVLAMKPACLVLDEPTAMLDPAGKEEVLQAILRLHREEGLTVVLITHLMEEAALADRLWVLQGGRLALEGEPREVFAQREVLREIGLGLPQPAELAWRLRARGWSLSGGIVGFEELVAGIKGALAAKERSP